MRLRRSFSALLLFTVLASLLPAQPAREALPGTRVFHYQTIGRLSLDLQVLEPAASFPRPRPAIVFFFGGGWTNGTPRQFFPFGEELTRRGMVSIFVDYRVSSRHSTTPVESVADAHAAMSYVRSHARELGIDPQRIVAAGGSAGGHLALATTLVTPAAPDAVSPEANLIIGYNPVADTRDSRWKTRFGDAAARIAPAAFVRPGLPDTLIFHGEDDTTVPIKQVRDFCDAMQRSGNRCHLEAYPGAAHGFFNAGRNNNRWYPDVLQKTIAFLREHGYVD